jgi:hypothetical protein
MLLLCKLEQLRMSDLEDYNRDLYAMTVDDPSLRYVASQSCDVYISLHHRLAYDKDAARNWLDSRGCYSDGLISSSSEKVDQWLYFQLPGWTLDRVNSTYSVTYYSLNRLHFQGSDAVARCRDVCFTYTQTKVTEDLFLSFALYPDGGPKYFTFDNTDQNQNCLHVIRAIHFSASVRDRRKNIGEPENLPSAWPIIFNFFFENVRADMFQYSAVDIRQAYRLFFFLTKLLTHFSYQPTWSLSVNVISDVSHIVPDAVFYVRALERRLFQNSEEGDTFHESQLSIKYNEEPPQAGEKISVPLLVVEYVKTSLLVNDGVYRHLDHLLMAMSSASGFYKSLGISHVPVFGLLVDRDEATLFAASERDFPVCKYSSQYCSTIHSQVAP